VPCGDLAGAASVVVDGAPAPGTVLCLSHWPGVGSPAEFAADLSADMAFRYLAAFDRHGAARAASNNHFDQDGLVGLFALVSPAKALARRAELIEVARAGDFAVTSSRTAARVSMVLSACADPERSPFAPLPAAYDDLTAMLYSELLGRLPELCDSPERSRDLWAEEDATWRASEAAVASGAVVITEVPDLDLAIVEVPEQAPGLGGHRFAGQWALVCIPWRSTTPPNAGPCSRCGRTTTSCTTATRAGCSSGAAPSVPASTSLRWPRG
jgi:hypothetical protein